MSPLLGRLRAARYTGQRRTAWYTGQRRTARGAGRPDRRREEVGVAGGDLLRQMCADLRLLWTQAGGPSLRTLAGQLGLGKSQLGAILRGEIRQLPEWPVVRGLVESFHRYAREHGRTAALSVRTGIEEHWRPRYTVVEHAMTNRTTPAPAVAGAPTIPRQLPPALAQFAGREAELAELTRIAGPARAPSDSVVVAIIDGMAGVGKTALALRWAHQATEQFPDGQLYVNLRGFDPRAQPVDAGEALRGFLAALGVPPRLIPAQLDAQVGLYRSRLAGRRLLVLLDNARDAEQVSPLLPGTGGCMALVTSRHRLPDLVADPGAQPLTLAPVDPAQARELLRLRLGTDRTLADPVALARIVHRCGGLPLALTIVAARAATTPNLTLTALADQLDDRAGTLDVLTAGGTTTDLRAVFSCSYRALTPTASVLFRLLAVHSGVDIGVFGAASLAGIPVDRARASLSELAGAHLLTEPAPGRYGWHDLLRAYAIDLLATHGTQSKQAALRRMLDSYLHTAVAADRLLNPSRDRVTLDPPAPGVSMPSITGIEQALTWFAQERVGLLAAVHDAATAGLDSHAWQLPWSLATYLERHGRVPDWIDSQQVALAATQRLGDRRGQARTHRYLGLAYTSFNRHHDAHRHLHAALVLLEELGDHAGAAHTHLNLARMFERTNQPELALRHSRAALELYRTDAHQAGQAHALNAIGWYHSQLGEHHQAIDHCTQALTLQQRLDDQSGAAHTWDSLGHAHHHLGDREQAIACYQQAIKLFRTTGNHYNEADTLAALGDVYQSAGDPQAARRVWRRAEAILRRMEHPDAKAIHDRLRSARPARSAPSG